MTPEESALLQATLEDQSPSEVYIHELEQALSLLLKAFDALLPGAVHISVDIGLLNEAAIKARPLVKKIKNG